MKTSSRQFNIRLSRPIATTAAVFSLWVLGMLGFTWMLHLGPWVFFRSEDKWLSAIWIGSFYLARFGSLLPSVAVASFLICCGHFRRPYVAVCGLVAGFHTLSEIR